MSQHRRIYVREPSSEEDSPHHEPRDRSGDMSEDSPHSRGASVTPKTPNTSPYFTAVKTPKPVAAKDLTAALSSVDAAAASSSKSLYDHRKAELLNVDLDNIENDMNYIRYHLDPIAAKASSAKANDGAKKDSREPEPKGEPSKKVRNEIYDVKMTM